MKITTTQDILKHPEQLDKLRAFIKECEKLLENPKQRWKVNYEGYGTASENSWYKYAYLKNPNLMYLENTRCKNMCVPTLLDSYLLPLEGEEIASDSESEIEIASDSESESYCDLEF